MINHTGIAILLLISPFLSPLSLAGDNDGAVNERIPVSRAEMEIHWQVDCAETWKDLLAAAALSTKQPANKDNCGIPDQLQREIQLCAFIHQAPGGDPGQDCPDYKSVSKRLKEAEKSGQCPTLVLQKAGCRPGSQ